MRLMVRHEPEVLRAKGRLNVAYHNRAIHEAGWSRRPLGSFVDRHTAYRDGLFVVLEIAEHCYRAHGLPYEAGLSKMVRYDPRRFTFLHDPDGDPLQCVKIRDDQTGRIVACPIGPMWAP
jgi:hypothetical protein